jgi:iron complex outermembrane receptor protein
MLLLVTQMQHSGGFLYAWVACTAAQPFNRSACGPLGKPAATAIGHRSQKNNFFPNGGISMFKTKPIAGGLALAFGGLASALIFAAPALAQQQTDTQKLERVEVTGSNIKRIEGETATPVQVISRKDIEQTGATSTEELLRTISAFSPAGVTVGANNAGANTGGLSSTSLRGLGAARTLVLINGKRIAPYGTVNDAGSVDVNSIPLAAIDRVEVLTQGASAIYGSDAIAGVVNFILRREYQGATVTAQYGSASGGGGNNVVVDATVGYGSLAKDRFNVTLLATYQKQDAIYGADRGFAKSAIDENNNNDTTSGNSFPANISYVRGSGRASGNPQAGNCAPSVTSPFFGPDVCRFDTGPYVSLLPETELWSVFLGGRYAITDKLEAYADFTYSSKSVFTQIQPVPLSDQFALPTSNPLYGQQPYGTQTTFLLNPSSAFYPASYISGRGGDPTQPVLVRYRAVESGNRQTDNEATQPRFTLGLTGTMGSWDVNASYLYMTSTLTESTAGGFPQYTKILPLLNSGTVDPFGFNSSDIKSQILAANYNGQTYENETGLQSLQLSGSTALTTLPGGPLTMAVGGEWRQESYKATPSQLLIQGDVSGYGGNQAVIDKSRNVYALYGELAVPIIKDIEANLAIRYDDYESVGSKWSPQVSARWDVTPGFLLRGAWSQGFRAPSLTDLYASNTQGVTQNGVNDPIRCPVTNSSIDCATQFATLDGGNSKLDPETSDNYTLGFVLEPTRQISFGATAWWITLDDAILPGGVPAPIILGSLQNYNRFSNLVTRGPVDPAFPNLPGPISEVNQTNINQGSIRLQGYDIDFKASTDASEWGRLTFALTGTYTAKYDITLPDDTVDNAAGTYSGNIPGPVPRWRQYATLGWTAGPWGAVLGNRLQTSYTDVPGTFDDPSDPTYQAREVDAYSTWDLQGSYAGFKGWGLVIGVRDLFNATPPYTNAGGQYFFQSGYDVSYVNPLGRFFYGRVSYTFK